MARNCSECKEKRAAHILCTYCNRWLCSSCTEEHRHGPAPGGPPFPRTQKGSPGVNAGSGDLALYCPLHTQEVLKLFCETCDVLTCHSCLMVEHKEHRCRHLEEVLQNQRMLLESVTTQVAHKKCSLQASAKQIEDRIFEVKHQHRKVENQIKMAKMVLMNELNKQANGLIEELEGITNERKRKLEQQLQSIMVLNRQFEHVQNFINWAVCSKTSIPFLFSKELIVFQMQRLLETNCNTDPGSPWSIRFTWEPNFWTKQLASLGCITTEGGQLSPADTPAYGSLQGPSSFYQSHQSPGAQQETLNHPSRKFQPPALCSSSVCCSHCSPVSPSVKGQVPPPSVHPAHSFRQPSDTVPQQLRSLQCSPLLPREKELPCRPHPPKLLQPWLETQPPAEQESTSQRLGQQLTSQPVCIVPPQDVQQGAHAPPTFQTPSVQVQLGHHQKLKLSHFQQQPPPPPQQQPPPPLPPSQHLASSQHESPPGPACSQNVDIMHHKFELEEMQKDLELLLQAQQPSLQLSQAKSPQHLQQTIVGQINYIVRQPAPVQSQSQEDTVQATDESPASEGPKPILPLDKNTAANLPQASGEETPHSVPPLDSAIQHSSPNVVRKHSTSVSIMGFSNTLEMELSSTRLARTLEPQIQSASSLTAAPPQVVPSLLSGPPPTVSSLVGGQNQAVPSLTASHLPTMPSLVCGTPHSMPNLMSDLSQAITSLASDQSQTGPNLMSGPTHTVPSLATCPLQSVPPASNMQSETGSSCSPGSGRTAGSLCPGDGADPSLGNALCKMESEDSTHFTDSLGQGPTAPGPDTSKDLAIPSELEEPINLSVKKPALVPVVNKSVALQQYQSPKECENFEQGALGLGTEGNQSIRPFNSEPKIPYVRLERLKICAASSGEMPVFKLKPQKNEQDGSFLLIIECGTECSSMSIKVSQDHLSDAIQAPNLGGRKVTVTSLAGQRPPEVESASSEEHRLIPRTPGAKKGPPVPIENEDFCAVCLNGGELLCCDRCPKVYHLSCHLPALLSFPGGDWVCTLCRSLTQPEMEYDCENARYNQPGVRAPPGLSAYDQKKCEKLVLSLCCNSLSLPFHEPVSPLARHYYQIIKRPMDLSIIRRKLQKKDPAHYTTPEEVVSDVRLMFWNCAKFNYPDSEVAEAGRCLEVFFEGWLKEIYPEKRFAQPRQEDSDSEEVSSESGYSTPQGFPWPHCMQEGIQPKRRRRHMENERAKRVSFRLANSISQV
ncbi:tripartite motif-containing protein 66 [Mesoplodon densirostris]|uniref:tripartite motif-containing protein 66 n=1 Tax=Mesoplodon densirostris TaxID=48708 RepID=UPI0028DC3452|nr:tripartite motif-containing protein 66 [Mesoplodon densirostris]XP_059960985.1 tripartite motif-containing protein 66 [Mesoplodon densirostris]XP_059960986.1 tripartite motif-containing protein 66 [Mesoplodon densirostris]XP_059960987.1 tripartite motif-containing protein 66 [Mesoplodon densirostris]XP_059960989.1 tripartite motif-containing protein 66 [Mesoplodon densirostris]